MDSGAHRCQNKNKIQKLQMDSGARHQSQKWTTGENTSNTIKIAANRSKEHKSHPYDEYLTTIYTKSQ